MNSRESHDPAELLHRALRDLPPVAAPRTLEERVLAGIAARAARPWWRQSAAAWPAPARAGLVAACLTVAAGLTLLGDFAVQDGLAGAGTRLAPVVGWWDGLRTTARALGGTAELVPTLWLDVLAAAGLASAAVLGGGIAAYRSLCTRN